MAFTGSPNVSHVTLVDGRRLQTHDNRDCSGSGGLPCPFHRPSNTVMKGWPFSDVKSVEICQSAGAKILHEVIVYRQCPHARSHPDPDSVNWIRRLIDSTFVLHDEHAQAMADLQNFVDQHDCCGCCAMPVVADRKAVERMRRNLLHLRSKYAEGGEHDSHGR